MKIFLSVLFLLGSMICSADELGIGYFYDVTPGQAIYPANSQDDSVVLATFKPGEKAIFILASSSQVTSPAPNPIQNQSAGRQIIVPVTADGKLDFSRAGEMNVKNRFARKTAQASDLSQSGLNSLADACQSVLAHAVGDCLKSNTNNCTHQKLAILSARLSRRDEFVGICQEQMGFHDKPNVDHTKKNWNGTAP